MGTFNASAVTYQWFLSVIVYFAVFGDSFSTSGPQ